MKINIIHPEDVAIIMEVYKEKDLDISESVAQGLWFEVSDEVACGWCSGLDEMSSNQIYDSTIKYLYMKYEIIEIHSSEYDAKQTEFKFYTYEKAVEFIKSNSIKEKDKSYRILIN